jgi:hypothetical protein
MEVCGIIMTRKIEVRGEKLSQCQFAHHKYDMDWPEI